jgi:hypothetical protein
MAHFLPSSPAEAVAKVGMVQILLSITRVAVQIVSEPEINQGAGFKLRVDVRIRVQRPLRICLGNRCKSKMCDKQLTFIVRVIASVLKLSRYN